MYHTRIMDMDQKLHVLPILSILASKFPSNPKLINTYSWTPSLFMLNQTVRADGLLQSALLMTGMLRVLLQSS